MGKFYLCGGDKSKECRDFIIRFFKQSDVQLLQTSVEDIPKLLQLNSIKQEDLFIVEYVSHISFSKLLEMFKNESGEGACKIAVIVNVSLLVKNDLEDFKSIILINKMIVGTIDTSFKSELHLPLLRSMIADATNDELLINYKNALKKIGEELGSILGSTLGDLQRASKMHEYVVPLRKVSTKGVIICGKYAVGEASGGEFFDIIHNDTDLVAVITKTKSYLASSNLISLFSKFRERNQLDDTAISMFITNIENNFKKDVTAKVQLFIIRINLVTQFMDIFMFGNGLFVSNFEQRVCGNDLPVTLQNKEPAHFGMQLQEGNKMLLLSPGIVNHASSMFEGQNIIHYLTTQLDDMAPTFLNEIFFQLSKNKSGDFLKEDASAIFIKVDLNVISN